MDGFTGGWCHVMTFSNFFFFGPESWCTDVSGNQMQIQIPCYFFFYHAWFKEQKKKLKEKSITYVCESLINLQIQI